MDFCINVDGVGYTNDHALPCDIATATLTIHPVAKECFGVEINLRPPCSTRNLPSTGVPAAREMVGAGGLLLAGVILVAAMRPMRLQS